MRSIIGAGALAVTTFVVACSPSDEVVFRGTEAGARGPDGGAPGGYGGGTGGAGPSGGSGGELAAGGALQSGGGPATGGASQGGGAPATGGASQAGGAPSVGRPCSAGQGCGDATLVCNRSSCIAPGGECAPVPARCPPDFAPVCGCDGITYWNDCLRLQRGVEAGAPGDCGKDGVPCGGPNQCGLHDASCVIFVPPAESCPRTLPPGQCWVAPQSCAPGSDPSRWLRCTGPFPPPPQPCLDLCHAVEFSGVLMPAMSPGVCGP